MKQRNMVEDKLIDPRQGKSIIDKDGNEDHSQAGGPLAVALRIEQRDSLGDRVRELIRSEKLALEALEAGYETFEEADDFDVPDDDTFDPQTPYEEVFAGSIQEDLVERSNYQREQLKNMSKEQAKEFLGAMDPTVVREVLAELEPAPIAPAPAPKAPE